MPITRAAKKALKRNLKQRERNLTYKNDMKKSIKRVVKAVKKGETDEITSLVNNAYSSVDKAAKRNIIHKNKAARKKSQIANLIK